MKLFENFKLPDVEALKNTVEAMCFFITRAYLFQLSAQK